MDGPLLVLGNRFEENLIGGTADERGGGGLRASLFGSFAEGAFLNNAFVGNRARKLGSAAWIESLDTTVEFSNNTAIRNNPMDLFARLCPEPAQDRSPLTVPSPQRKAPRSRAVAWRPQRDSNPRRRLERAVS